MTRKIDATPGQYAVARLVERMLGSKLNWYFIFDSGELSGCTADLPSKEKQELLFKGLELMNYKAICITHYSPPDIGYAITIGKDAVTFRCLNKEASCLIDINSQ